MKWMPDVVTRLLGRQVHNPELDRADRVLDNVESIKIKLVPKNQRALAELRRLESHARR